MMNFERAEHANGPHDPQDTLCQEWLGTVDSNIATEHGAALLELMAARLEAHRALELVRQQTDAANTKIYHGLEITPEEQKAYLSFTLGHVAMTLPWFDMGRTGVDDIDSYFEKEDQLLATAEDPDESMRMYDVVLSAREAGTEIYHKIDSE